MTTLVVPFRFARGRAAITSDARQIAEQQIVDILVTNPPERVMRPDYGAGIAKHLFDPLDDLVLADASTEALSRMGNLTVARVHSVRVRAGANNNSYQTDGDSPSAIAVDVDYSLPESPTTFTFSTPLMTVISQETGF